MEQQPARGTPPRPTGLCLPFLDASHPSGTCPFPLSKVTPRLGPLFLELLFIFSKSTEAEYP